MAPLDESSLGRLRVQLREEVGQDVQAAVSAVREGLRREIRASAAETRRHFDVVAESLVAKIEPIAEGLIGIDQKLDRFRGEVRDEFARADRRLLLEARVFTGQQRL